MKISRFLLLALEIDPFSAVHKPWLYSNLPKINLGHFTTLRGRPIKYTELKDSNGPG